MTQRSERPLTLACVADQSPMAAALHEALAALFPSAAIVRLDTEVERVVPDGVDCAVVDSAVHGQDGLDVLRGLRARGFAGAAVLVVDPSRPLGQADETSIARLGARTCSLAGDRITPLASAVAAAMLVQHGGDDGTPASQAVRALRQTERLLAAGELAPRLQHALNNPLAALLAEAQLLELETLTPDHRGSVERIVALCRRVIDVVRGQDGVGRA